MKNQQLLSRIAEDVMREKGFIPHPSPAAEAEAAAEVDVSATEERRDMRPLPWSSIDNPESQDLDQIEYVEAADGGTLLYVGIADVDHFVARGSEIDRFARNNTTSVYSGARTFPMLPERLSFGLSSLLPGHPRAAVVIETLIHDDGSLGKCSFYPALVENKAKLDYPSVSAWLDGAGGVPPPGPLATSAVLRAQLEQQDKLSQTLAAARRQAGALDVDTAQVRAVVDATGQVTSLVASHQDRAGRVIEELMIASNRGVACALDSADVPSLRRVVKQPERWARIVVYAAERGTKLPATPSSKALAAFVDEMRRTRADEFAEISLALVKLMGRGEYVAHAPDQPEIGHFGLATSEYTHATAPNRRYPDLVTQRILKAVAARHPSPYRVGELADIAEHCSKMEAEADKVTRRVQKSAAAELLAPDVGHSFDAIVTGVTDRGTYVRILSPVAEGKLVHGDHGCSVGDKLRVKLIAVNIEKGFIDFAA